MQSNGQSEKCLKIVLTELFAFAYNCSQIVSPIVVFYQSCV